VEKSVEELLGNQIDIVETGLQDELDALDNQLNGILGIDTSIKSLAAAEAAWRTAVANEASIQDQIDVLEKNHLDDMQRLTDQYNQLVDINANTKSIAAAIAAFLDAQRAVVAATPVGTGTTPVGTGTTPVGTGTTTVGTGTTTVVPPDVIEQAYMTVLGRKPEAAGEAYYEAQLAGGKPISEIYANMYASPEYKHLTGVPGYAGGGSHSGGWRMVGEKGPELEFTGPSRIVNNQGAKDLMDNIAASVDRLREDIKLINLQVIKNAIQKTAKVLDKWDSDGMPDVRVV
jgi:hypothetical protein